MREVLSARSSSRPNRLKCQASPCVIVASVVPVKRWLASLTSAKNSGRHGLAPAGCGRLVDHEVGLVQLHTDTVHDLWECAHHARPLPCGKNDGGCGLHFLSLRRPVSFGRYLRDPGVERARLREVGSARLAAGLARSRPKYTDLLASFAFLARPTCLPRSPLLQSLRSYAVPRLPRLHGPAATVRR